MWVFTMVTEAARANALPFSVVIATTPGVENLVAAEEIMVPSMVPPPADLPKDIFRLGAVDQDNAASACRSREAHGERGPHLENPDSIRVAPGVEREIPYRYAICARRGFINARGECSSAQFTGAGCSRCG
jgi:hypothetical protein